MKKLFNKIIEYCKFNLKFDHLEINYPTIIFLIIFELVFYIWISDGVVPVAKAFWNLLFNHAFDGIKNLLLLLFCGYLVFIYFGNIFLKGIIMLKKEIFIQIN